MADARTRRFYEIAENTAKALGCRAEIAWEEGYPVAFNDEGSTSKQICESLNPSIPS